jgi:hypothetical protein
MQNNKETLMKHVKIDDDPVGHYYWGIALSNVYGFVYLKHRALNKPVYLNIQNK